MVIYRMSQKIRTASDAQVSATLQRTAIVDSPYVSTWQIEDGTSASAPVKPASTAKITININPRDIEQEEEHYLDYLVENTDATQNVIFPLGPLTHWEMEIGVNKSSDKIKIDDIDQIREIMSDYFFQQGLKVFENTYFWRNELDTFNGVTVVNGTDQRFWFPLNPFINFAKTTLKGKITDIVIDLKATPAGSNPKDSGLICRSSAATNAYTRDTIIFKDIRHRRRYVVLNDPRLDTRALAIDKGVELEFIHWDIQREVVRTGSWNIGDSVKFKLSDIASRENVQHITPFVRINSANYNSATCCQEFSGAHYIGWKTRELFGEKRRIDMTDKRTLMDFEMKQYSNEYGRLQLPIQVWKDKADLLTKYFLRMTRLNFDYMMVEQGHEMYRHIHTNKQDHEVELFANDNVGDDCDVVVIMVIGKKYRFNKNDGEIYEVY